MEKKLFLSFSEFVFEMKANREENSGKKKLDQEKASAVFFHYLSTNAETNGETNSIKENYK